MQSQPGGFFPRTLNEWLAAIGLVAAWIVSGIAIWNALVKKVNGLGDRVNVLEHSSSEKQGRMDRMEREVESLHNSVLGGAQQLGEVKKAVDSLEEHVVEMKIELAGAVAELKNIILEKNATVRERIVKIETKLELDGDS